MALGLALFRKVNLTMAVHGEVMAISALEGDLFSVLVMVRKGFCQHD